MNSMKEATIMNRLPTKLNPMDFFKILEEEPQEIVIKDVDIKENLKNLCGKLYLTLQLVDTQQTCTHSWNISYSDSSREYYIEMKEDLHPLLAYESGIKNNALMYSDDELVELLTSLKFKATGKIEPFRNSFRDFTIIPLTEKKVDKNEY